MFNELLEHENICWSDKYLKKQEVYWKETFRKPMINDKSVEAMFMSCLLSLEKYMHKYANQLGIVKTNVPWTLKKYCFFTAYKFHLFHALQTGDKSEKPNFAACILHYFTTEQSFLLALFGDKANFHISDHEVMSSYSFFFSEGFM
jgi:hypothetical protein